MKKAIVLLTVTVAAVATVDGQARLPRKLAQILRVPTPQAPDPPLPPVPSTDSTPPVVAFNAPTAGTSHDNGTTSTVNIGGTTTDNVGVAVCAGSSDRTGAFAVTGTTSWSATGVTLANGANVLTVTCHDSAGNSHFDTLTVTYNANTPGACVPLAGACADNISDSTPAVGQLVTVNGQDLYRQNTTGWLTLLANNPNMHTFEGTIGQGVHTISGFLQAATGGVIVDNWSIVGTRSAYYRSTVANPQNTTCTTGQGAGADYNNFTFTSSNTPSNNDFWFGYYVRYNAGADGWPSNFMKGVEPLLSRWYIQVSNNQDGGGANPPRNWIVNTTVDGVVYTMTLPDGVGVVEDRPYWISGHLKRTSPTTAVVKIDTSTRLNTSTTPDTRVASIAQFGIINACPTKADALAGNGWDVEAWYDHFVISSQEVLPPTQAWLCPTDDPTPTAAECVWLLLDHTSDTATSFTFRKTGNGVTISNGSRFVVLVNQRGEVASIGVTVP